MNRPIHVPLYAVVVLAFGCSLGPVLSITASVKIANTNTQKMLIEQERAREEARRESSRLVCAYFTAQLDGWDEEPPTTPAGKNFRQTTLEFYAVSGCQPPRK